jgi:hypothetical protein
MGQQQLLLLVLSTVIVGLATVAGIQAFSENQVSANADALTQRSIRYASDIQAYYREPEQFGGGGNDWPSDLSELSGVDSSIVVGSSGKYTLSSSNACSSDPGGQRYIIAGADNDGNGTFGQAADNLICVGFNPNEVLGTQIDDAGSGSDGSGSFSDSE